jgi:hypothetical protein
MQDKHQDLKQKIIENLKTDPLKTSSNFLKYIIKHGETPFQAIDRSERQGIKNDVVLTSKQFQNRVESGDIILGSRRSNKIRILTPEQMELHKHNKFLLDLLQGGKPRKSKKRTSKKRTSKKRTSKKRTSKKRTSKKRTSKKRTSNKKLSDKEKLCRSKKIKIVMGEFKEKKLKLKNGTIVKNPKQAIAIALSEAGRYC